MKIIVCDDKDCLILNPYIGNAFDNTMQKSELFYLTVGSNFSQENLCYDAYQYIDKHWNKISENSDIKNTNLGKLLEEAYILLDTKWKSDDNMPRNKIKDRIVWWCQNNPNKYQYIFVYTTFGINEAYKVICDLKNERVNVYEDPKSISPTNCLEQQYDFEDFFKYLNRLDNKSK